MTGPRGMSDAELDRSLGIRRGAPTGGESREGWTFDGHMRESDAAADRARGVTPVQDGPLMRDLCEAGLTSAAARGVLGWLDRGATVDQATATVSFLQVQSGKVAHLCADRARAVCLRHRPELALSRRNSEAAQVTGPSDARIADVRESLIVARMAEWKSVTRDQATAYAEGAIRAVNERALREGWTFEQILERLRAHVSEQQARSGGRVGVEAPDRAPQRPQGSEASTSASSQQEYRDRFQLVSEADLDRTRGIERASGGVR